MITCKEASRLLSESLERRLPFWQRVGLRFHLCICRFCARFAADLRRFHAGLRNYSQRIDVDAEPLGASLSPAARERILRALREDSQ
jgi:hypothetical protein